MGCTPTWYIPWPTEFTNAAPETAVTFQLTFAGTANGKDIVEFDFMIGREYALTTFPTPPERRAHSRQAKNFSNNQVVECLLTPTNLTTSKEPRY